MILLERNSKSRHSYVKYISYCIIKYMNNGLHICKRTAENIRKSVKLEVETKGRVGRETVVDLRLTARVDAHVHQELGFGFPGRDTTPAVERH